MSEYDLHNPADCHHFGPILFCLGCDEDIEGASEVPWVAAQAVPCHPDHPGSGGPTPGAQNQELS